MGYCSQCGIEISNEQQSNYGDLCESCYEASRNSVQDPTSTKGIYSASLPHPAKRGMFCHICRNPATQRCFVCGKFVCNAHIKKYSNRMRPTDLVCRFCNMKKTEKREHGLFILLNFCPFIIPIIVFIIIFMVIGIGF
ncbi:MAG: hypothetical protein GY870_19050 [archaeon]|nr:hypothetical protein [archaeon]